MSESKVHTVSAIIVAIYIESYFKAVEVEAHRNVHGVDAVVEAPGEDEVGAGVGDHPARDLQCLLLVGLEQGLGARRHTGLSEHEAVRLTETSSERL